MFNFFSYKPLQKYSQTIKKINYFYEKIHKYDDLSLKKQTQKLKNSIKEQNISLKFTQYIIDI